MLAETFFVDLLASLSIDNMSNLEQKLLFSTGEY